MRHTVTEHTLATGTKGLLIDVPGSEVVNIKFYFRAGYRFGDFSKYEIPHVLEHHIRNATRAYPGKDQVKTELARNGAYVNAFTNPSYIGHVAECADVEVEHILELMTEIIARPTFPAAYYEVERDNVRTELTRNLSEYDRTAYVLAGEANFPRASLNYKTRINQLESIEHSDVIAYYRKTHTALNGTFVISGSVKDNQKVILAKLEQLYSELSFGQLNKLVDEVGLGQSSVLVAQEAIDSIYFQLDWFGQGLNESERAAGRLLGSIITGGFASRIYGKARERGITYHVGCYRDATDGASALGITGFCSPAKWAELLQLISIELADLIEHGPSTKEVEEALQRVCGGITLGTQTASAVAGWYSGDYIYNGLIESYDEYFALLKQVTAADIQAIAEHYFSSKRHSAAIVGKVGKTEIEAVDSILTPVWK